MTDRALSKALVAFGLAGLAFFLIGPPKGAWAIPAAAIMAAVGTVLVAAIIYQGRRK